MNTPPRPPKLPADVKFRKSSYSEPNQNCVDLAHTADAWGVRDSKVDDSPILTFGAQQGLTFLRAVQEGTLDTR